MFWTKSVPGELAGGGSGARKRKLEAVVCMGKNYTNNRKRA